MQGGLSRLFLSGLAVLVTVAPALGLHRFRVRAIDKALNVDPTPATDTWRIRR